MDFKTSELCELYILYINDNVKCKFKDQKLQEDCNTIY